MTKDEELEKVLLDTQYFVYPKYADENFIYLDGTFSISDLEEILRIMKKLPDNLEV